MNTIDRVKQEDNDRVSRLTRNTKSVSIAPKQVHPLLTKGLGPEGLTRRDSSTSFLTRRYSSTSPNLLSSRQSFEKEEPKIEPIKRSIFKAYLLPIFLYKTEGVRV